MPSENILVVDIPESRSSFIKKIEYDEDTRTMVVHIRPYAHTVSFENVYKEYFLELCNQESIGTYYNNFIKPNFKQTKNKIMAERPKTKNLCSDEKRFLKMSINVQEIIKDWLVQGKDGVYLNITLQMLPNGQLDKYGNLGMITQDVPKSVYESEKGLKKSERTRGPILGNACEFDWEEKEEGLPGMDTSNTGVSQEVEDDLPF